MRVQQPAGVAAAPRLQSTTVPADYGSRCSSGRKQFRENFVTAAAAAALAKLSCYYKKSKNVQLAPLAQSTQGGPLGEEEKTWCLEILAEIGYHGI